MPPIGKVLVVTFLGVLAAVLLGGALVLAAIELGRRPPQPTPPAAAPQHQSPPARTPEAHGVPPMAAGASPR